MGFCCLLNIVVIVAIGGIDFIVGIGGTCIPCVYRRRDDCVPVIKQAGTPAHTGQALLILCSWVAHSLLLLYFFSTTSSLLLLNFFTTSSLLFHYSFTTPSLLFHYSFTTSLLLLYFFDLLLLCSLVWLPINRDNTFDCTSFLWSFVHTKSADLMLVIHQQRPSHCL